MATRIWPASIRTGAVDYAIEFDVQITIARSGRITTYGLPGARWTAAIRFESDLERLQRPAIEALIASLNGGAHRLQVGHLGRPRPNGTLTGSPTLSAAVAAGATSLSMVNANGTLKAGDIIGLPGQMFMVIADATPVATNLTVQVTPAVRTAHNSGTPVAWNRPQILWIPRSNVAGPFPYMIGGIRPGMTIELVEAYS